MEYRNGIHEERIFIYLWNPAETADMKSLASYDKHAKEDIEMLQEQIETLKAYRLELAERANQIATMSSKTVVTLKRERRFEKIQYYLITNVVYEDGTKHQVSCNRYDGRQRAEAIREFKKLQKENPHFDFVQDIERSNWEKQHNR